jgi:hypothetical protein
VEVPVARIDASKFTYHKLESGNFLGGPLDRWTRAFSPC